ncbi:hypothetical protein EVAR_12599_1 [Eumeta japonica]|uniref:Uncharacterized protein n=1 Tax=Eumeta variegata TaxID=151549 RepID=A0A4C1UG26_EUMVA|nr:hypothetical protein EVAR_12599_1 [Eumeta japonica]
MAHFVRNQQSQFECDTASCQLITDSRFAKNRCEFPPTFGVSVSSERCPSPLASGIVCLGKFIGSCSRTNPRSLDRWCSVLPRHAALALAALGWLGAAAAYSAPDLPGPYCARDNVCCDGRKDNCSHEISAKVPILCALAAKPNKKTQESRPATLLRKDRAVTLPRQNPNLLQLN